MTSSATLRVLEKGALKTGMPRRARRIEVDLVGADAEAADRDQPVGSREARSRVIWVRERMPRIWTPLQGLGAASAPSSALVSRVTLV